MPPSLYHGSAELASSLRFVRPTIDVQSFGGDGGGFDGGNDGGAFGGGFAGGGAAGYKLSSVSLPPS